MKRWNAERFEGALSKALSDASQQTDTETALSCITRLAHDGLGDQAAHERAGALLPGERDYRVSGVFAISPDEAYNMLLANCGFPSEQRRLAIPIDWNHPGEVVRTAKPILLENTDDHGQFRQFLKTSKMGSSIYVPMLTPSGMKAQIVAAAQSRWTYDQTDLARLGLLASAAALIWQATDGDGWLRADYPASDLWRADETS